jgi:hypothetical protein
LWASTFSASVIGRGAVPVGERQQAAGLDDERGDRIVAAGQLVERDGLAVLEAGDERVIAHELPDVDVVAGVDRRERRRDRHAAAAEHLALRRGLARAADALLGARHDHLEVAVGEGVGRDEALAVDDQAGVRVARDRGRIEIEADPRRRHRVGVDVVEQVLGAQVAHAQRQLAGELAPDQLRVLGQVQDPLAGGERELPRYRHLPTVYHASVSPRTAADGRRLTCAVRYSRPASIVRAACSHSARTPWMNAAKRASFVRPVA